MGNREDTALAGTLIERDDVEVRPERLPAKITDPSIDVYRDGSVDDGHTSLACERSLGQRQGLGFVGVATQLLIRRM